MIGGDESLVLPHGDDPDFWDRGVSGLAGSPVPTRRHSPSPLDRRFPRRMIRHGHDRPRTPRAVAGSVGPALPRGDRGGWFGGTERESDAIPLCPACRGRIGNHPQPDPGLPGRPRAGPRRHGGRLPGPPHGRRRARGAQDDQTGRRSHSGGDRPLPPRGADPERAGSPEYRVVP